ncbi:accessory factor UbiK family protein [Micavibrio aeruginosavorus]|uniref:accessory factor UbiK family protein n=1 Tax=Micavibrio aeruginosavorus TaxID=349221 RepID=UPI003F4A9DEA
MTMKPDPRILDDLARVAGGAVNIFSGLHQQIHDDIRARIEDMAAKLDLVPRDDFDRLAGAVDKLRKRVDELEAALSVAEGKKAAPKKTATKKAAPKATKTTKKKK